jgi:DNA ligase D-like protein (predicted ligase)
MLAVRGEPFDSPEWLFEVKWNGIRALAARQTTGWQLWGRERADYTARYPELDILRRLPKGTVLDGELVLLPRGLPDLETLLARHHRTHADKIEHFSREQPVSYVVFDLLCHQGRWLLGQPLSVRRQLLQQLLEQRADPRLVFSNGVIGTGRIFFAEAVKQGQEGIMAKHSASRYLPGRRSSAWRKIKPARLLPCVIIGWVPGQEGVGSLLVAAPWQGRLQFVAQVRMGFTGPERRQLAGWLAALSCPRPVVPCPVRGRWVKPEVFCQVRYVEWTPKGRLRGARFQGLRDFSQGSELLQRNLACRQPTDTSRDLGKNQTFSDRVAVHQRPLWAE